MLADKDETSVLNGKAGGADSGADAGAKSKLEEHHYEPEAHHQWFPSERFFFSWLTTGCCGFVLLGLAVILPQLLSSAFRPGDICEHEIRAVHALVVPDEFATRAAQERARSEAVPVFKPTDGGETPIDRIKTRLDMVTGLQKAGLAPVPELTTGQHLALLKATDDEFNALFANQESGLPAELTGIRTKLQQKGAAAQGKAVNAVRGERGALRAYLSEHGNVTDAEEAIAIIIAPSDMPNYRESLVGAANRLYHLIAKLPVDDIDVLNDTAIEFMPDSWTQSLRKASAALVSGSMQGAIQVDRNATTAKAEKLAAQVKPLTKEISVGDLIVSKGKPMTEDQISTLQAMGMTGSNRWPIIGGLLVSLTAAVCLVTLFLYTFEAKLLFSTRSIGLMYTIATVTMILAVVLSKSYAQFIPIPAAALLLSIFFGQRGSAAVVIPLVILIAVDRLIPLGELIALTTAAGAAIATYSKRRHSLMSTGLLIGVAQAFGFLAALSINHTPTSGTDLGSIIGMEFLGGLGSSIIAIGMLPFLENIFGLITPFRLAELTDADQPLLRRLEETAPGTYQHSLGVANMAEAGARSIGADVNLVRAGAYYHDVGKLVRPKYFIENQLGATNPHDAMPPEQSRERVLAHVTDGLELAKKYALPKAVQDFIPMHQGTSLMAYFYHKACVRDGVDKVDPKFYRYPGPKPQSKETSIVMLADVSEAVTHSMKSPSEEEVETAIDKVFQNRWDDGQFSESGLTYMEMQRVKRAFVRVWRTLHHDRLKYPSTTTGRMPVPPQNLSSLNAPASGVAANEFSVEPPDESGTARADAAAVQAASGANGSTAKGSNPNTVDPSLSGTTEVELKPKTSNGNKSASETVKNGDANGNGIKKSSSEIDDVAPHEIETMRDEGCS